MYSIVDCLNHTVFTPDNLIESVCLNTIQKYKYMKERINKIISNKKTIVIIYILFALFASIQSLVPETKTLHDNSIRYTKYNNYIIFKNSFDNLINNQDLYILYPEKQWDLYKYTPTFSVFFGLLAILPDWIGLNLWNLLNALFLLFSIYYLPKLDLRKKGVILIIILIELMTSMQNSQSNGLIAGLLVLSFGLLEHKKYLFATLCIVFSFYIKLFGIVGFALFLFYPNKWKLGVYTIFWALLLGVTPLIFIDINQYSKLLESYMLMLNNDHSNSYGYSIMGLLNSWFSLELNKNTLVLLGMFVFLIPLSLLSKYKNYTFKFLGLASVLIWIVIFNHKAESPTFIIAMTGVALWFVSSEKNILNTILVCCAFVFTSLSPTDIFPKYLRDEYVIPYTLKAFPCIIIWLKIIYDMMVMKDDLITEKHGRQQLND